ncbi:MAG TPA: hypothetical protein DDY70_05150, partial [Clostridiales bacterium]|nr:hypothetical protein [Clostridiales bacterium]
GSKHTLMNSKLPKRDRWSPYDGSGRKRREREQAKGKAWRVVGGADPYKVPERNCLEGAFAESTAWRVVGGADPYKVPERNCLKGAFAEDTAFRSGIASKGRLRWHNVRL